MNAEVLEKLWQILARYLAIQKEEAKLKEEKAELGRRLGEHMTASEPAVWHPEVARPLLKSAARVLFASGVAFYLLLVAVFAVFQRRVIYFPETLTAEQAAVQFKLRHLAPWPAGEPFRAVVRPPQDGEAFTNGTMLVFHGNATSAYQLDDLFGPLQKRGWRAVLAEFPGYAGRPGTPSEAALIADARETAKCVRALHPGPLALFGLSLGTGVAAALAADPEIHADAVILATPFDSLVNVGAWHYPWLPVRLLLLDRWDSVAALRSYRGSLRILMAEHDEVVPEFSTRRLLKAFPRATLTVVPEASHNDWLWQMTDREWNALLERNTDADGRE
jgi:pimeloyl-ACP methyl ester carboxylesterase